MIDPNTLVCHEPARRRLATAVTAEVLTSPFGSTRAQSVAAACRRARGRWGSARAGRGRSTHCAEVHVVGGRLEQRGAAVTPRVGVHAAPGLFRRRTRQKGQREVHRPQGAAAPRERRHAARRGGPVIWRG